MAHGERLHKSTFELIPAVQFWPSPAVSVRPELVKHRSLAQIDPAFSMDPVDHPYYNPVWNDSTSSLQSDHGHGHFAPAAAVAAVSTGFGDLPPYPYEYARSDNDQKRAVVQIEPFTAPLVPRRMSRLTNSASSTSHSTSDSISSLDHSSLFSHASVSTTPTSPSSDQTHFSVSSKDHILIVAVTRAELVQSGSRLPQSQPAATALDEQSIEETPWSAVPERIRVSVNDPPRADRVKAMFAARKSSVTRALDKIDELDETDPLGMPWHHNGPYEAIKKILAPRQDPHADTPTEQPNLHPYHDGLELSTIIARGQPLNIMPGQYFPAFVPQLRQLLGYPALPPKRKHRERKSVGLGEGERPQRLVNGVPETPEERQERRARRAEVKRLAEAGGSREHGHGHRPRDQRASEGAPSRSQTSTPFPGSPYSSRSSHKNPPPRRSNDSTPSPRRSNDSSVPPRHRDTSHGALPPRHQPQMPPRHQALSALNGAPPPASPYAQTQSLPAHAVPIVPLFVDTNALASYSQSHNGNPPSSPYAQLQPPVSPLTPSFASSASSFPYSSSSSSLAHSSHSYQDDMAGVPLRPEPNHHFEPWADRAQPPHEATPNPPRPETPRRDTVTPSSYALEQQIQGNERIAWSDTVRPECCVEPLPFTLQPEAHSVLSLPDVTFAQTEERATSFASLPSQMQHKPHHAPRRLVMPSPLAGSSSVPLQRSRTVAHPSSDPWAYNNTNTFPLGVRAQGSRSPPGRATSPPAKGRAQDITMFQEGARNVLKKRVTIDVAPPDFASSQQDKDVEKAKDVMIEKEKQKRNRLSKRRTDL